MTNNKKNITDMPYAKWLEETLHDISDLPIRGFALVGVLENGDAYTSYWNTPMTDKLMLAGLINQDAMLDALEASGFIEYEDDEEEEEENYGEEKE